MEIGCGGGERLKREGYCNIDVSCPKDYQKWSQTSILEVEEMPYTNKQLIANQTLRTFRQ